jgi:hypothetical protein
VTASKQFAVWLERDAGPGRLAFVMARTRRYSIEIRNSNGEAVFVTVADWDKAGRRAAAAQILKKRRFSICVPSLERQCRAAHRGQLDQRHEGQYVDAERRAAARQPGEVTKFQRLACCPAR